MNTTEERTEEYTFFYRTKSVFSQWHPCTFKIDGITFNCAEQWMMYAKALLFDDRETAQAILETQNPREQKRLGRKIKNFDQNLWDSKGKEIVYKGNYAKFSQDENMKKQLLSTAGTLLVEASPTDNIWGIGLSETDPRRYDKNQWQGTNFLGEVLTRVREDLIER